MRPDTVRWLTRGLGTILALIVSSGFVQGGYSAPSGSGSLLDEVSAFVGDFGQWNTSLNDRPVQILQSAPAADQGGVAVILFWFWLQDQGSGKGSAANASHSSPPGSTSLAGLSRPPSSGNPSNSSVGSIVMSQLGNDPPSSLLPNGGNNPPSLLSNGGGDPPSIGSNGGSSSLLSALPPSSGGGNSGQQFGSFPPIGGGHAGDSGTNPMGSADPTPAPASFTLLAVGGAGMLLGTWMRRRRFDCCRKCSSK